MITKERLFLEKNYIKPLIERGYEEIFDLCVIPDGTYKMNGSGYSFSIPELGYTFVTNNGVRGQWEKIVIVKDCEFSCPASNSIYKLFYKNPENETEYNVEEEEALEHKIGGLSYGYVDEHRPELTGTKRHEFRAMLVDFANQCFEQFNPGMVGWISVEDDLPNNTFMCAVIMYNKFSGENDEYGTGIYDIPTKKWEVGTNRGESYEVTHWMPLPNHLKENE